MTADPKTKVYGDAIRPLDVSHQRHLVAYRQLQRGADPSGRRSRGHATRSTQGTLALSTNYALTYVGADLTITARPITVTADAQDQGLWERRSGADAINHQRHLVAGDSFSGALTRVAGEAVGTLRDRAGHARAEHQLRADLRRRRPDDYGAPDHGDGRPQDQGVWGRRSGPDVSLTSGNLVAGDSFSGALTRVAGEAVGTYAIEQGTLALSTNYALTYVGADLTITARPITVTADAQDQGVWERRSGADVSHQWSAWWRATASAGR